MKIKELYNKIPENQRWVLWLFGGAVLLSLLVRCLF